MSRYRISQKNDQEKITDACHLLINLIKVHQKEIEPALWISAMIYALSDNFEKSGIPFSSFKKEMEEAIDHYEY